MSKSTHMTKVKTFLVSTAIVLGCNTVIAQSPGIQWQGVYGGTASDYLTSSRQTPDGGYIFGGYSNSGINGNKTEDKVGLYDYWIIKTDADGNIEWQNTIGGTQNDYLNNVEPTADGGYILGGTSFSDSTADKSENKNGAQDFWIVKVDGSGNIVWENTIGGDAYDYLHIIHQTPDGGYIAGGYSDSGLSGDKSEAGQGFIDYWIVKLDASGNIEWDNTIGGNGSDNLFDISLTTDGGYIIAGGSTSGISGDKTEAAAGNDYWILKLDGSGNIEWQNTLGAATEEIPASIVQTGDGGYLVGGKSNSGISGDKTEANIGNNDYWVLKLDASGNIEWQNTIGGTGSDIVNKVMQASDGEYMIAGTSSSPLSGDKTEASIGLDDYWLVKIDELGVIKWDNTIGGNKSDNLVDVQVTNDNGYMLGGYSSTNVNGDKTVAGFGGIDFWTIKLLPEICPVPFGAYADNITAIKATVHWNPIPSIELFQIWYRAVGDPTWLKKTTTTNSKVLKSLAPSTTYEYKIRTKCLDGDFGEFTALNNFTTLPLRESDMNERSFISVYPNPANGIVTISYETSFMVGNLTLTDITGKVVLSATLTDATTEINISGIPAGLYIVTTNFDGNSITEKLVIQ